MSWTTSRPDIFHEGGNLLMLGARPWNDLRGNTEKKPRHAGGVGQRLLVDGSLRVHDTRSEEGCVSWTSRALARIARGPACRAWERIRGRTDQRRDGALRQAGMELTDECRNAGGVR